MVNTRTMQLTDQTAFARIYDEHASGVYGAALRVLGNPATAQDVAQDVFLKLWRQPRRFDARRGDLGPYLRLMARSRAPAPHREGQAAGRAGDRLRLLPREPGDLPAEAVAREDDRELMRGALHA